MTQQEFGDGACGKQRQRRMWRRQGTDQENGEECEIDISRGRARGWWRAGRTPGFRLPGLVLARGECIALI